MLDRHNELYKQTLAEVRKALADAKITQSQIGDALGIKQSAVSSLLSGKSRMSLDQFLILSELVGIRPQTILQNVHTRMSQVVQMTSEQENTLYRSDVHLIAYCAAVQEVSAADFNLEAVPTDIVQRALDELVTVDLLVKKRSKYSQKHPQLIFRPSNRLIGTKVHQAILKRSCETFDRHYADRAFIATKFNSYQLDRFSTTQIKEIELTLWQVYEKIQNFRQSNMSNGYTRDEPMPLWNIHLMLMTPEGPAK